MYIHRFFYKTLLTLLFIFIVSCSSTDDKNNDTKALEEVANSSASTEITVTSTITPIPEVDTDVMFADSTYEAVYIHDGTLYYLSNSATNQPEIIEEGVHPASLVLSPDYSSMIFGIANTEMDVQSLDILDFTTMNVTKVELPDNEVYMPPVVLGWSPDSEWVVLSFSPINDKVIILNVLTGNFDPLYWYSKEEQLRNLSVLWLSDNRLLVYRVIVKGNGSSEGLNSLAIADYILDPATGEQSTIELSDEALRSLALRLSPVTLNTLDKELQSQGLALAQPRVSLGQTAYYDDLTGAATVDTPEQPLNLQTPPCDTWDVQYKPIRDAALPQQLYHAENAAILSDLYLLSDYSLLLAQWKSSNCDRFRPEELTVELLHVDTNNTVQVIASNVSYGWIFDFGAIIYESLPIIARSNLYAVSPNGQYIACVEHDGTTTSIIVVDLEIMQSATIEQLNYDDSITSVIMFRIRE